MEREKSSVIKEAVRLIKKYLLYGTVLIVLKLVFFTVPTCIRVFLHFFILLLWSFVEINF